MFSIAIASFTLFLSLWIVVPAPIFALLPLGVGAPEISPWLVVLSLGAIALSLIRKVHVAIGLSAIALVLSLLPVVQLFGTIDRAQSSFEQAFGNSPAPSALGAIAGVFRGVPIAAVRQTAAIEFAKPDGVPLHLEVYRPLEVGIYPAIVAIYGGAWRAGSPSDNADFNRYMAAKGYVVWAIDYRHAPQFRFPIQLEDVKTALQFIRDHAAEYETDVDRIGLIGRSAGAHLAMLAGYQANDAVIRSVVNYYGPVDLAQGYADPPSPDPIDTRAVLEAFLGGTPAELPEQYRQASPIEFVNRSTPPTLLIYGSRDHIVQAKFGRSLFDRLRSEQVPSAMIELPWSEHAFDAVFRGLGNQIALFYVDRFFAATLKDEDKSNLPSLSGSIDLDRS
ncbi:alpha/beta hydrolase [Microcoleus sp. FACHB-1515]|uniref:alpha/beta hydrolase n=1 Tax=Cyanophyceae TaxID=3028117 RepID=UPI001689D821|nr:alpha/beta hydrolase [Microcoleus sp. FACHB-1515]MBD2088808.1 alpha/beta hydrolase [Microcoleus sp. FACHB-1515]